MRSKGPAGPKLESSDPSASAQQSDREKWPSLLKHSVSTPLAAAS